MGILEKLQGEKFPSGPEGNSQAEKRPARKNPLSGPPPPSERCDCGSAQFWLDAYGQWNCGSCLFPRSLTMVRKIWTVENDRPQTFEFSGETWLARDLPDGGRIIERLDAAELPDTDWRTARTPFEELPDLLFLGEPRR